MVTIQYYGPLLPCIRPGKKGLAFPVEKNLVGRQFSSSLSFEACPGLDHAYLYPAMC